MIEVEHLTKIYGNVKGVEDLTFSVKDGEILGFLGPNGAGKTTTMRIITGYIPPTSGTVRVSGYDVFEETMEVKKRVGYLPENPPLYRDMTVAGYLNFVAELKGVPKSRRRDAVEKVVAMTGVEGVYGRLIENISKGYKQRVGLAQALIGDPEVLVLDEPTVGLDPKQIIEIRKLIQSFGKAHTVILSSHILPEVQAICERVVIINKGRLVAIDTPEGLSSKIRNSRQLLVRIKGPEARVRAILEGMEGINAVSVEERKEGENLYRLETGLATDVRERLFYAMAEERYPILELRSMDLSLEEVFLELTTEESTEVA